MTTDRKPELCKRLNCTYCNACSSACKHAAISFVSDDYGFSHPIVNNEKCVGCGLCEASCPVLNPLENSNNLTPDIFALYSKDEKNVSKSSSGGVFYELAQSVIADGGCVFGVVSSEGCFKYECAETLDEVLPMRGSKYVQAEMNDALLLAKKKLVEGRKVLFSGTPCQVAALRRILRNDYSNLLLTVEVICHGVPSQSIFDRCMNLNGIPKEARKYVSFRDTRVWNFLTRYTNETIPHSLKFLFFKNDIYMRLFMKTAIYKPICYQCPFARIPRVADMTIGDFWGVKNTDTFKKNQHGTSVLLLNTKEAHITWEKVKYNFIAEKRDLSEATNENPNLIRPTYLPADRDRILEDLFSLDKKAFVKKYHLQLTLRNVVGFMKRRIKSLYAPK